MFLNLLTSVLLSIGVSSCVFQEKAVETPKIEKQCAYNGSTLITGGYCFNHVFDDVPYFEGTLFTSDVYIDFEELAPNVPLFAVDCNSQSDYPFTFVQIQDIYIYYDSSDNTITFQSEFYYYGSFTYVLSSSETFNDSFSSIFNGNLDKFGINLLDAQVYLSENQKILFDIFFTKQTNINFLYYSGWITVNPTLSSWGNGAYSCFFGDIFCDNNMFIGVRFSRAGVNSSLEFAWLDSLYQIRYKSAISNGAYGETFVRLYTNGLFMTMHDYNNILPIVTFSFIPDSTQYTLTDLFFDIGDTPVVFITGLFDFEFLGVNLSVAIMGLLTIICMAFLIKKVI